ncbi:MAG: hypothetical protein EAZ08_10095 [Cytophagales bacterium]|nr:MAG: hypothetical protein EAZ08_10095 [Cytophagales bacterium]
MPLGTEKFSIRTSEVDFRHRLTIPALVNFLQETAMHNIGAIGLPMHILEEKNLGWVLSRQHLKIAAYPRETEQITVETCPHSFEKYYAYRDFRVYNSQQEIICTVASSWLLFDLEKRQLIAIPDFVKERVTLCTKHPPLPIPKTKIQALQRVDYQANFQVSWHTLDLNKHTNNVYYFQWALDTLPEEVLNQFSVSELDIMFRNESLLGEKVIAQAEEIINEDKPSQKTFIHRIIKEKDGKEVIQAKVQLIKDL